MRKFDRCAVWRNLDQILRESVGISSASQNLLQQKRQATPDSFSEEDREEKACRQLMESEAKLQVGLMLQILSVEEKEEERPRFYGLHIDTVRGERFDGVSGVIAAVKFLEGLRRRG
jgi:hypothetical protein